MNEEKKCPVCTSDMEPRQIEIKWWWMNILALVMLVSGVYVAFFLDLMTGFAMVASSLAAGAIKQPTRTIHQCPFCGHR